MREIVKQVQGILVSRGFDLGRSGPAKNGVDGDDGQKTWDAILAALDAQAPAGAVPIAISKTGSPVDLIDVSILRAACPERSLAELQPWVEPIKDACRRFEINTIRRIASFISQMAHESNLIPGREENLNYSAKRLAEVFPSRYASNPGAAMKDRQPNARARSIGGDPVAVANDTYANRMGNGPPASGDGWKYRGAGPGQLTGYENWRDFAAAMKMSVDQALIYARTIAGGIMSFAWFWEENDINRLAETPGVEDETRRINGGQHGVDDRRARFNRTVDALLKAEAA